MDSSCSRPASASSGLEASALPVPSIVESDARLVLRLRIRAVAFKAGWPALAETISSCLDGWRSRSLRVFAPFHLSLVPRSDFPLAALMGSAGSLAHTWFTVASPLVSRPPNLWALVPGEGGASSSPQSNLLGPIRCHYSS